jgi:hypothetical protein
LKKLEVWIRRNRHYLLLGWLVSLVVSVVAIALYDASPRMLRAALRIDTLPASVNNANCISDAITDVVTVCSFRIEPGDVEAILAGWKLSGERGSGGSLDYTMNQVNFTPFKVDYVYRAERDQFGPQGGHMVIAMDKERRNVLLDLFIE